MVELIERKSIFDKYKIIASEVSKIQKAYFSNDVYSDIELEDEKIEYKSRFDAINYDEISIKYDIKILTINSTHTRSFPKKLFETLLKLFEELDINGLFILLDLKINYYLSLNSNKYKPLVRRYNKLEGITHSKYYDEAFYLSILSEDIVEIIFWLSRCCPYMNTIMLFDKNERYYLNICQWGNIHIVGVNENTIPEKGTFKKIGLEIIERC